jgi:hypothetical protein
MRVCCLSHKHQGHKTAPAGEYMEEDTKLSTNKQHTLSWYLIQ